jgi:MraZ protein
MDAEYEINCVEDIDLMGEFDYTLDAKGRVSLPKQFRRYLGNMVVVTRGTDGPYIWLLPIITWKKLHDQLISLPNSREAKRVRRYIIGSAHEVEIDTIGRIQLPTKLRNEAAMKKDLIIKGVGGSIELWDKATFEMNEKVMSETQDIQSDVEKLGI